jgi:ankyrin repeat protein
MWAAANGRLDNMALLMKAGADVNRATLKGFTPLFFAIKSKEPKAAQALLDAGADRSHTAADGTSAVQLAVYQRRFELARQLVGMGVDLKAWDRNGEQLLHAATAAGDEAFVDLLLAKGADPNALTGPSRVEKRRERNQGGVLPKEAPVTPLLIAAREGSDSLMRRLVGAGARPDFRAEDGVNVLLAAASSRKTPALQYALQISGDVNAVSEGGQSALHIVAGRWSGPEAVTMIRALVERGARLDLKNGRGMTPQDVATRNGEADVVAVFAALPKPKGAARVAQTAPVRAAR